MEDLSTKYTVIRLKDPDHIAKLEKYLEEHRDMKKTSFCRFFLRGLCIMKPQYCKFAHDFDELDFATEDYKKLSQIQCFPSEREARKKLFIEMTDFYQRPLFFIKDLDYVVLHRYQGSGRYKQSNIPMVALKQVNKNEPVRNRIRQIMHREQWDKFIAFLESFAPEGDYTISFYSTWFARLGFEKAQTMCKFGDFIRYLTHVKNYYEVYIVVPPLTTRSVYFIRNKDTYLYENLAEVMADNQEYRQKMKKVKQAKMKKLPLDLYKRFVCRYYMVGCCQLTREQCSYVHDIEDMNYEKDQEFLKEYRQTSKSKEERENYILLYRYHIKNRGPDEVECTLEQINSNYAVKNRIRKILHLQVYRGFLKKLEEVYKLKVFPLAMVKQEYTKFGFNHTDENKFGQFEDRLWQLGFHLEEVSINGVKNQYIYRIPSVEQMDATYHKKIGQILEEQLGEYTQSANQEKEQILQSSIRRLIYSKTDKQAFEIPLHVYLRKKGANLKKILENFYPQYIEYIFFESSEQNFKKLQELLKKYFKKQKRFVYKLDEIDSYIRGLSKDLINMNSFVNFKNLLELSLLELGKQIYLWPISNASLIVDRSHSPQNVNHELFVMKPQPEIISNIQHTYSTEWDDKTIVVDNEKAWLFCKQVLENCGQYGVDLEGKLAIGGYIDFIQISCILEKKHIFIIDVYKLGLELPQLLEEIRIFLKFIFENMNKIKIMHACRQDATALLSCMGITLRNVFDTAGCEQYFEQKQLYLQMHEHNQTYEHTLRKIHTCKSPGLNQVLQKWQAPKGPNQLKEYMKKIFTDAPRSYFETRPIIPEFLTYSSRDVEDLIEVYRRMVANDPQQLWRHIGELYAQSE